MRLTALAQCPGMAGSLLGATFLAVKAEQALCHSWGAILSNCLFSTTLSSISLLTAPLQTENAKQGQTHMPGFIEERRTAYNICSVQEVGVGLKQQQQSIKTNFCLIILKAHILIPINILMEEEFEICIKIKPLTTFKTEKLPSIGFILHLHFSTHASQGYDLLYYLALRHYLKKHLL